jgi:hypothetical protein
MRPKYMGRTVLTFPVSESEMDQISSLSAQVTVRFAVASLLVGLGASIWTNAIFVNEMTPSGHLATYFAAPILLMFATGYAVGGLMALRKKNSTWEKIKFGAEPIETVAEARGLMLTGSRTSRRGRN